MVICKGVNFYPSQVEAVILRQPGLGPEYQIALDSAAGGDHMAVLAEAEAGCDAAVAGRLRQELRDLLGISPEVRLCEPGGLPRSDGKAVRVVDRRSGR